MLAYDKITMTDEFMEVNRDTKKKKTNKHQ
jgi:hypothetical protein